MIGRRVDDALSLHHEFLALMQGRGQVEPDEERLEDGIAFAGVARFPARVKCALLPWMAWKDATVRAGTAGRDPHSRHVHQQIEEEADDRPA
jgi:nitrogen fixation NifU-like protein